jgi:hypothetical protein
LEAAFSGKPRDFGGGLWWFIDGDSVDSASVASSFEVLLRFEDVKSCICSNLPENQLVKVWAKMIQGCKWTYF